MVGGQTQNLVASLINRFYLAMSPEAKLVDKATITLPFKILFSWFNDDYS